MPEISDGAGAKVHFMTANALETLFALNALAHPERRPFLSAWAADVQARLTAGERDWLAELGKLPELFQVGDILIRRLCFHDVREMTAIVAELAPDELAAIMLDDVVTGTRVAELRSQPDGATTLRAQYPWLWNGDEAVLATIIGEPERLRDAVAGLLPRVYELGVEPMLPRLTPLWERTIAEASREAERKDPKAFAFSVFGKPFARRYGPDHVFPQYIFVPTFFFSPMRAAFFVPELAVVTMDCRLGPWTYMKVRDGLAEGLRAIAEPSRLEILRVLTMDKAFGGWVAGRLKLNPATVTHHMAILRKAGFLTETDGPPGAAKYYRTDREAIQRLIKLLQDYLDSSIEPDWEGASDDE